MTRQNWITYFISLLVLGYFFLIYKETFLSFLDPLSMKLVGKAVTTRGNEIRNIILFVEFSFCVAVVLLCFIKTQHISLVTANPIVLLIFSFPIILMFVGCFLISKNMRLFLDDFLYINDYNDNMGNSAYFLNIFSSLQGRYSSYTYWYNLISIFKNAISFPAAIISSFSLIIVVLFFIYSILMLLFPDLSKKQRMIISIPIGSCLLTAIFGLSPNMYSALFRFSSANYGIGTVVAISSIIFQIRYALNRSNFSFLICLILIFLSCGFCELISITVCLASGLIAAISIFHEKRRKPNESFGLFVFSCVWTAATFFFPGKQAALSSSSIHLIHQWNQEPLAWGMEVLEKWCRSYMFFLKNYFSPDHIIPFLLFIIVAFIVGMTVSIVKKNRKIVLIVSICTAMISFLCILPNILTYFPYRAMFIPSVCLTFMVFLLFLWLGSFFSTDERTSFSFPAFLVVTIFTCLIFTLFFSSFYPETVTFAKEHDHQEKLITKSSEADDVVITCAVRPLDSDLLDLFVDPSYRYNMAEAKFYNRKKISAQSLCEDDLSVLGLD